MTETKVENFKNTREKQNAILAKYANQQQKRFFGLDAATYQSGSLDKKTKELLGFTASLVLRCDDCILYTI